MANDSENGKMMTERTSKKSPLVKYGQINNDSDKEW